MTRARASGALRSFRNPNFRLWSAGALVSNVGAWMQRIAQDWLVLTQLTHHDARALSLVVALQFAPQVLLLPWTGWASDHLDRRRLLLATQTAMGLLALGLGCLTIAGAVRAWHVDVFALLLGCASAFDAPARQTFVTDMVGDEDLPNAVALNATSFHASGAIGPAVAAVLIAAIGSGWLFVVNAASFLAVIASLLLMRTADLRPRDRPERAQGGFAAGIAYVRARADLQVLLAMLLILGVLGLNIPLLIAAMTASVFHAGAADFGLFTASLATGCVAGAGVAARRDRPRLGAIVTSAAVFAVACLAAAAAPSRGAFALTLVLVGAASQATTTSMVGCIQVETAPAMRGRVSALLLTVILGGQALGAPLAGAVAQAFGPRCALALSASAGVLAAALGAGALLRNGRAQTSTATAVRRRITRRRRDVNSLGEFDSAPPD